MPKKSCSCQKPLTPIGLYPVCGSYSKDLQTTDLWFGTLHPWIFFYKELKWIGFFGPSLLYFIQLRKFIYLNPETCYITAHTLLVTA